MFEIQKSKSDILLVSFGGLAHQVGFPIPEFKRILTPIKTNKAFFFDKHRCWYYKIRDQVKDKILEVFEEIKPRKVIFFGVSAGGYAAILFGTMFNVDRVLAFNPQSFLSPAYRKKYKDNRWPDQMKDVYKYSKGYSLELWDYDIAGKTVVEIFYCQNYEKYRVHSEQLKKRTKKFNIVMHPYQCPNSAIAKNLKNSGELFQIFSDRIKLLRNEK